MEHLRRFVLELEPEEETSAKTWTLAQLGSEPEHLEPAVKTLGGLLHSTEIAEQAHVLVSRLLQKHPLLSSEVMQARVAVSALSQLVARGPLAANMSCCNKRIARIRRRMPERIRAKQA